MKGISGIDLGQEILSKVSNEPHRSLSTNLTQIRTPYLTSPHPLPLSALISIFSSTSHARTHARTHGRTLARSLARTHIP